MLVIVVVSVEMSFVFVVELATVEFLVCCVALVLDVADAVVLMLELTSLTVVSVTVLSMIFVLVVPVVAEAMAEAVVLVMAMIVVLDPVALVVASIVLGETVAVPVVAAMAVVEMHIDTSGVVNIVNVFVDRRKLYSLRATFNLLSINLDMEEKVSQTSTLARTAKMTVAVYCDLDRRRRDFSPGVVVWFAGDNSTYNRTKFGKLSAKTFSRTAVRVFC